MIVDPEAAKVVKEIFGYAIQGSRLVDIAETLNKKGYETPSAYYRRKHPESKLYANTSPLSGWTIITVEKIIEQERYYGAIVQHKREGSIPYAISDAWVDGRYVNNWNRLQLGETFSDHSTASIVLRNVTYTDSQGKQHKSDIMYG